MAVETFNREVALILSLAFLCEGVVACRRTGKIASMLIGVAVCIGVYAVILAVRRTLLVAAVMPPSGVGAAGNGFLASFLLTLTEVGNLAANRKNLLWQLPHWLVVLSIALRLGWEGTVPAHRRAALWLGAVFLAVWAVGYVVEWRVWLDFVPYLTLALGAAASKTPAGAAPAERNASLPAGPSGG